MQEQLKEEIGVLDCWSIKLGADPPAAIPEYEVKLKMSVQPYRAKVRRYSPEQSMAIAEEIREMEAAGLIRKNNSATWANPVMALPKPNGRGWRLVVDLVQTNRRCQPRANSLPMIESKW